MIARQFKFCDLALILIDELRKAHTHTYTHVPTFQRVSKLSQNINTETVVFQRKKIGQYVLSCLQKPTKTEETEEEGAKGGTITKIGRSQRFGGNIVSLHF